MLTQKIDYREILEIKEALCWQDVQGTEIVRMSHRSRQYDAHFRRKYGGLSMVTELLKYVGGSSRRPEIRTSQKSDEVDEEQARDPEIDRKPILSNLVWDLKDPPTEASYKAGYMDIDDQEDGENHTTVEYAQVLCHVEPDKRIFFRPTTLKMKLGRTTYYAFVLDGTLKEILRVLHAIFAVHGKAPMKFERLTRFKKDMWNVELRVKTGR